jgi:hypothetical protein
VRKEARIENVQIYEFGKRGRLVREEDEEKEGWVGMG